MDIDKRKFDVLINNGYVPLYPRDVYYHPQEKKVFGFAFIHESQFDVIERHVYEPNTTGEWQVWLRYPSRKQHVPDVIADLEQDKGKYIATP